MSLVYLRQLELNGVAAMLVKRFLMSGRAKRRCQVTSNLQLCQDRANVNLMNSLATLGSHLADAICSRWEEEVAAGSVDRGPIPQYPTPPRKLFMKCRGSGITCITS